MRRIYLRRWSPRSKVFLVLAVACGLGAFALVRGYEARLAVLRPAVGAPIPVVVAAKPLVRGSVLGEDVLRVAQVPSAFAPPGSLRSIADAVGRTLVSDLATGEAVTRTRVGTAGGPVAAQVPSGLRAFVVPSGMPAGTVRAGDRVDVLATFGGPRPYSDTVASGLEVLSVLEVAQDGFAASGSGAGPSLVLLVAPDAAERLAYAKAFADLTVTIAGLQP
ncbi:MAG: Flp pilus assembly protein CpaB [Actinomycetota bacterium]